MKKFFTISISIIILCTCFSSCSKDYFSNTPVKPSDIIGQWSYKSTDLYLENDMTKKDYVEEYLTGGVLTFTDSNIQFKDASGETYIYPYILEGNEVTSQIADFRIKKTKDGISLIEEWFNRDPEVDETTLTKHQIFRNMQIYKYYSEYYVKINGTWIECASYNDIMDQTDVLEEDIFFNIEYTHWKKIK